MGKLGKQLLFLRRKASALVLAIVTLLFISGGIIFYNQYLMRQKIINNYLYDQFIAESMVKMSKEKSSKFNTGTTKKTTKGLWKVTLNDHKVIWIKEPT